MLVLAALQIAMVMLGLVKDAGLDPEAALSLALKDAGLVASKIPNDCETQENTSAATNLTLNPNSGESMVVKAKKTMVEKTTEKAKGGRVKKQPARVTKKVTTTFHLQLESTANNLPPASKSLFRAVNDLLRIEDQERAG